MHFPAETDFEGQYMTRSRTTTLGLVLGLAFSVLAARPAAAEFFAYNTAVVVDPATSAGLTSVTGNDTDFVSATTADGGSISITGNSNGSVAHLNGSGEGTDIVFGYINADSFPTSRQMVSLDFSFRLDLTDYAIPVGGSATGTTIGASDYVTVSGTLSGSIGAGLKINLSHLSDYQTDPLDGLIQVGSQLYEVTLNPMTFPGQTPGAFGAHIRAVPEPAGLVLCGLGALGLGGLALRRRGH